MVRTWLKVLVFTVASLAPVFHASQAQMPASLARFDRAGPFQTMRMTNGGFTFFVPQPLGANGMVHPVVTWGNGTFTNPDVYAALLTNFASHGIVVVASNSSNVGTGRELLQGLDAATTMFGRMIDTTRACAAGHSQGGGGTLNASEDPRIICSLPIAPEINLTSNGRGTDIKRGNVLILGGQNDVVAPVPLDSQVVFNGIANGIPSILAVRNGIGHNEILGAGGVLRGYATAFLVSQLMRDPEATALFFPDGNCGICRDPNFAVQRNFQTANGAPAMPGSAATATRVAAGASR